MSKTKVSGCCIVNRARIFGHDFRQHHDSHTIWMCWNCEALILLHPDRNPLREIQREAT